MIREGRIVTQDWNLYDTRHVVYRPVKLAPDALKSGYDWAYREFYRWSSIASASLHHGELKHQAKHFFYAAGWKKFEPLWDLIIRARQLNWATPLLEAVLSRVTRAKSPRPAAHEIHQQLISQVARAQRVRVMPHDEVVKDASGKPLLRVCRQTKCVNLSIPSARLSIAKLADIKRAVAQILQRESP